MRLRDYDRIESSEPPSGELDLIPPQFLRPRFIVDTSLTVQRLPACDYAGVYTDLGPRSCGPGPGSYGHYEQDAMTFKEWGGELHNIHLEDCGCRLLYGLT